MDEFGSPIAGGIRAVRRNISSSMLVPRRQNEPPKADPVTTNLLTDQSLQLKSVSRQLEVISNTLTGVNGSLSGISENLALSDRLDKERERANQNRERILAEQGLREGKESALERKIQNALLSPIRRVGAKAQKVLFNFQKFFLLLAGGWLTNVGIDLINALVTGNTDELNKLKTKFVTGLVVIGATVTALNIGLKSIFSGLSLFVTSVSRVAFGGILPATLAGFKAFLISVATKAGLVAAGAGGVVGGIAQGIAGGAIGARLMKKPLTKAPANNIVNLIRRPALAGAGLGQTLLPPNAASKVTMNLDAAKTLSPTVPKKGVFNKLKNILPGAGKTGAKTTSKVTSSLIAEGTEKVAKKGFSSILKKFASKGLGKFFKGFGPVGALIEFVLNLSMGMGVGEALVEVARSTALFALGQALIPIPIVGGLLGYYLGDKLLNQFGRLIKNVFGFKLPKAIVGDVDGTDRNTIDRILGADDFVEGTDQNIINAISNNNDRRASEISVEEDSIDFQNISLGGNNQGGGTSSTNVDRSNIPPKIAFNTGNDYSLFSTTQFGVA